MDSQELERTIAVLGERLERLEAELRDARWEKVAESLSSLERRTGELITQLNANVMQVHQRVSELEKQRNA